MLFHRSPLLLCVFIALCHCVAYTSIGRDFFGRRSNGEEKAFGILLKHDDWCHSALWRSIIRSREMNTFSIHAALLLWRETNILAHKNSMWKALSGLECKGRKRWLTESEVYSSVEWIEWWPMQWRHFITSHHTHFTSTLNGKNKPRDCAPLTIADSCHYFQQEWVKGKGGLNSLTSI